MYVVTLSASFGAGGGVIGPMVAERLGIPFLDRAIPARVAAEMSVPVEDAHARDEQVKGWFTRFLSGAAPWSEQFMLDTNAPRSALMTDSEFVERTQAVLRRTVADGGGVILGRAGALVLADCSTALHVRLDGDPGRRARQAARLGKMSETEAMTMLRKDDNTRTTYMRHFYRTDVSDPRHYHLILDSTRLPLDACTDVIVAAAAERSSGR